MLQSVGSRRLVGILMGLGHAVNLPHQPRVAKEVFLFHMAAAAIQPAGCGLADCVEIDAMLSTARHGSELLPFQCKCNLRYV